MTSKKSFLGNLKANLRRRVWLFVIMFLYFFFTLPVATAMTLSTEKSYYSNYHDIARRLGFCFAEIIGPNYIAAFLIAGLAVIAGIQGFSYMYQRKKLDLYMSMPVSKESRFAAIYINGILAYLIPYLFHLVLSIIVAKAMGADISYAVKAIETGVIGYLLLYLSVYHIAILAVMLTGNIIVTMLGTAVFLSYDGIAITVLIAYMSTFFSSFYYKTQPFIWKLMVSPLTRFWMMLDNVIDYSYDGYGYQEINLTDFWKGMLSIVIVGVLALVLAYLCYRKKPAEACGKAMAFPCTKPVIKVFLTVLAGLSGGVIFYGLSGESTVFSVFGLVMGVLLCHGVVEVIYDFDIRSVKNGWKSLLISAAFAGALFSVFWFDLFGYDRYVPDAAKVDHAAFTFTDEYYECYDENLNSSDRETYVFDNMELTDIAPLLTLADRRMGEESEENEGYRFCVVKYVLKNGRTVYRQFRTNYLEDVALLDAITESKAYRESTNQVYNDAVFSLGERLKLFYFDGSRRIALSGTAEKLRNAYKKDSESFKFSDQLNQLIVGKLQFECIDKDSYVSMSLPVYPSFQNTIALLKEEGTYTGSYLDISEVERMTVTNSNSELYQNEEDEYGYNDYSTSAVFEDKQEISQIMPALYPDSFTDVWTPDGTLDMDYYVDVMQTDMPEDSKIERYSSGFYMLTDKIPDFVKERTAYTGEMAE